MKIPGRVGVPPAEAGILPGSSEGVPQDAKHGGQDAHPTHHDTVAPHLAAYAPEASATQQRGFLTHQWERMKYEGRMMKRGRSSGAFSSFIIHPSTLDPAPSHPIRNRLLRLTADSPDLLAIIKQEGKV